MKKSLLAVVIATNAFLSGCEPAKENSQSLDVSNNTEQQQVDTLAQADIDNFARSLQVSFEHQSNQAGEKCETNKTDGLCFEAKLLLTTKKDLPASGWTIYYSQIAPLHNYNSDDFHLEHINGDLHKLTPKANFKGLRVGESYEIPFRASFWSVAESDIMPNMFVVADATQARVIESTAPEIDADTKMEYVPFVKSYSDYEHHFKRTPGDSTPWLDSMGFYQRNLALGDKQIDVSKVIIPTPKKIVFPEPSGQLDLSGGIRIHLEQVKRNSVDVAIERLKRFGIEERDTGVQVKLTVRPDNSKLIGSYSMTVIGSGIRITGVDEAGVFNGLQSLASLMSIGQKQIPFVTIQDEPLYEFRGLLVDVARNFRDKDFIIKLMDQMAAYKLNKLHLHMGEDEGWRLEIPGLPELTEVSSKRCYDPSEQQCLMPQLGAGVDANNANNGYYSVEDYKAILRAASARHIQVLPSLDMPGHSRAAIKAMEARYQKYTAMEDKEKAEQYLLYDPQDNTKYSSIQFYNDNTINACQESSYAFVKKVMTEVQKIHSEAGQPLTRYHIGADETAGAWLESPVCKAFIANNNYGVTDMKQLGAYFVERVANMLFEMGIEPAAWSDGLEHTNPSNMPAVVQANAWGHLPWGAHHTLSELVNRNWQVVLSIPDVTYFDFPYEADPKEHGYYWASRRTNTEKVFQFMPQNIPVHAEFWLDRQDNPFVIDDTTQHDEQGNITHQPMAQGKQYLGIQGQLWSENVRTDQIAEYKIFPRVLALAERAWHKANWAVPYNYSGATYEQNSHTFSEAMRSQRDEQWKVFANALGQKEMPKMDLANVTYRLPTVGAKIEDNMLFANIAFPGLQIEYKDSKEEWRAYRQPIKVAGEVFVRSATSDGNRKSRIVKAVKM